MASKKASVNTLDRDWVTVEQSASYLQCCTATIHRLIKAGKLQGSQLVPRGKWRISASSIEKLLNCN